MPPAYALLPWTLNIGIHTGAKGSRKAKKCPKTNMFDLTTPGGFVTALLAVLGCEVQDHIVVIAIVCSSFVSISRGTTRRTFLSPLGDTSVKSVRLGNLLAARHGFRVAILTFFAKLRVNAWL